MLQVLCFGVKGQALHIAHIIPRETRTLDDHPKRHAHIAIHDWRNGEKHNARCMGTFSMVTAKGITIWEIVVLVNLKLTASALHSAVDYLLYAPFGWERLFGLGWFGGFFLQGFVKSILQRKQI